jgi:hypothetical protein
MLCERSPPLVNHVRSPSNETSAFSIRLLCNRGKIEACLRICMYAHISRDTAVQIVNLPALDPFLHGI